MVLCFSNIIIQGSECWQRSWIKCDQREETISWSIWATEGYRKSIYSCPSTIASVCLFFNVGAQMETDAPRPRLNCAARETSEKQELQLFQRGCRRAYPSSSFLPHSLSFTVPFFSALSLPATSPSLTWALIWKSLTSHSPRLGGSFQRCICSKPLNFSSNAHAGWIKDECFDGETTTKSQRGGFYSSANPRIQ